MGVITENPDIPILIGAEIQIITKVDTLKNRGNVVKPVGSFMKDFKVKV